MPRAATLAVALLAAASSAGATPGPVRPGSPFVANLLNYGGNGSGNVSNTAAFAAAVAAVAKAGGGTLYVPPGTWLTGPFNLTSGLTLQLDNATILASANFSDWQVVDWLPSYGRGRNLPGPRYGPLIWAVNCSSVRITSASNSSNLESYGVVDGQGAPWWNAVVHNTLQYTPGHLIETMYSTDVEIDHMLLRNSPFWNLHVWASQRVWVHDYAVRSDKGSVNTDGVDPDSSDDVLIENVDIVTGDDCTAIKSGWNQAGVDFGMPVSQVVIRNFSCTTEAACVAVGSEMSGGAFNLSISGVNCRAAGWAINIKSAMGRGGTVANVSISDMAITGPVGVAVAVGDTYTDRFPPAPIDPMLVPSIRDITISNVYLAGNGSYRTAGELLGLNQTQPAGCPSGFITALHLSNLTLPGAANWHCGNVTGTQCGVTPAACSAMVQQC